MSLQGAVECHSFTMRTLLLLITLLGTAAFAEAGFPSFDLCTTPPCACGVNSCACGEICDSGQCRSAQMGFCGSDSQCGSGSCGRFVCNFNVCVASDGGAAGGGGAVSGGGVAIGGGAATGGGSATGGGFAMGGGVASGGGAEVGGGFATGGGSSGGAGAGGTPAGGGGGPGGVGCTTTPDAMVVLFAMLALRRKRFSR
jgi:hypothetical protein